MEALLINCDTIFFWNLSQRCVWRFCRGLGASSFNLRFFCFWLPILFNIIYHSCSWSYSTIECHMSVTPEGTFPSSLSSSSEIVRLWVLGSERVISLFRCEQFDGQREAQANVLRLLVWCSLKTFYAVYNIFQLPTSISLNMMTVQIIFIPSAESKFQWQSRIYFTNRNISAHSLVTVYQRLRNKGIGQ